MYDICSCSPRAYAVLGQLSSSPYRIIDSTLLTGLKFLKSIPFCPPWPYKVQSYNMSLVQSRQLNFLTHHMYAAKPPISCRESQESQRLFLIEAADDRLMPRRNASKN
jgi:hypothetical protein